MFYKYIMTFAVILLIISFYSFEAVAAVIEGKVVNKETGQPIASANVTVKGTALGTATDSSGSFILNDIDDGQYTLRFTHLSFRMQDFDVTVKRDKKVRINVKLSPTILHLETTVITTTRELRDRFNCPVATDVINRSVLEHRNTMVMANVFDQIPGVSLSTTGRGSIRPVIRGLYDTHVLTLIDGIPMNDLRPGGDHVMLIEPDQIERIEIVKGPGSVMYGSDAIGGMVNFVTMPGNSFTAEGLDYTWKLRAGGSSNGNLYQTLAELGLGSNKRFIKARFGHKKSGNISDPEKIIPNSNYEGNHVDLMGGLRGHLLNVDLVYHYLIADVGVPIDPAIRHSEFEGEKQQFVKLSGTWKPDVHGLAKVETNLSYQQHNRHFHLIKPSVSSPDTLEQDMQIFVDTDAWNFQVIPTTLLSKRSVMKYGIDVLYQAAQSNRKSFTTDLFGGQQEFLSPPRVIPNSLREDLAFFFQNETSWRDVSFFSGVRYDWVQAESMETDRTPVPPSKMDGQSFSGNIGAVWHWGRGINFTGQAGRAFRSPTLLELYFWGPHQTTVDRGNPELKPETSLNLDLGLNQRSERYEWAINGFRNTVDDYIYKRRTKEIDSTSGLLIDSWENLGDVLLVGGEIQGTIFPCEKVGIFSNLSYVEATDLKTDEPISDIPPMNGGLGMRFIASMLSGEVGTKFAAKQDRLASNETATPAYIVYNVSLGISLERWLKIPSDLNMAVTNVFDTKYYNHLSRTKNWYFEPGRNFSLSLTLLRK